MAKSSFCPLRLCCRPQPVTSFRAPFSYRMYENLFKPQPKQIRGKQTTKSHCHVQNTPYKSGLLQMCASLRWASCKCAPSRLASANQTFWPRRARAGYTHALRFDIHAHVQHAHVHVHVHAHVHTHVCGTNGGPARYRWFVIILSDILSRYKRSYTTNPARVEAINA